MSRVLKSASVIVDGDNRVKIDVMPPLHVVETPQPEPVSRSNVPTPDEVLTQAKKGANMMIDNASAKAKNILREAREEAGKIAENLKDEAMRQGYEEGFAQGEQAAAHLIDEARAVKEEAILERQRLFESAESDMLALIVKVVKKLLTNTIHIHPDVIMILIRAGLSSVAASGDITVRVSEQDYTAVLADRDEIAKQIEASSKLEIIKDLSLNPTDCIIETPFGCVDCSLDRQYNALVENLYHIYSLGDELECD